MNPKNQILISTMFCMWLFAIMWFYGTKAQFRTPEAKRFGYWAAVLCFVVGLMCGVLMWT